MDKPIIGVTGMVSSSINGLRFSGAVVATAVLEAIVRSGAEPRILFPGGDPASDDHWEGLDGLVVPGGSDINPRLYGQDPIEGVTLTDVDYQDEYDLAMLRGAIDRRLPTLAICRGMQLLNVAFGGDLIQHIDTSSEHVGSIHPVELEDGTLVRRILGKPNVDVSSYHHQAAGRLGEGLLPAAVASDGTIEALELAGAPLVAVQWHPEDRARTDRDDQVLFDWLAEAARTGDAEAAADAVSSGSTGDHRRVSLHELFPEDMPEFPADAPEVAVVAPLYYPGFGEEEYELIRDYAASTVSALHAAGARVVVVDPGNPETRRLEDIERADGVLYLGGGDIDPRLYGGDAEAVAKSSGVDRESDEFSVAGIRATLERDAPLLAVCRGSQVMNVALGGTLIPDLVPGDLHHGAKGEPMFVDEEIHLDPESKIGRILGRREVVVRSGHHQAVEEPGQNLRVVARALDGTVEGVEHTSARWALGLQWHPEDPVGNHDDFRAIIEEFVSQVRTVMRERATAQAPAGEPGDGAGAGVAESDERSPAMAPRS
ncbi:hypothetical protein GCM10022261_17320 [Brevibacterium daeguense]|uniref:Glutamine amidotransferase n=1 Tax=Brevibacterium daeguense TaxID=909936 RepID=A0ABP8EJR4_9MICO|nr:gamma-glutamyl-gamma-aminobutyrate hydrolase family protein [Brevibacterium daeguense]